MFESTTPIALSGSAHRLKPIRQWHAPRADRSADLLSAMRPFRKLDEHHLVARCGTADRCHGLAPAESSASQRIRRLGLAAQTHAGGCVEHCGTEGESGEAVASDIDTECEVDQRQSVRTKPTNWANLGGRASSNSAGAPIRGQMTRA